MDYNFYVDDILQMAPPSVLVHEDKFPAIEGDFVESEESEPPLPNFVQLDSVLGEANDINLPSFARGQSLFADFGGNGNPGTNFSLGDL